MPARVEVIKGPQSGCSFEVRDTDVRIGRGAGNAIRMKDPSWTEGHLRLLYRQGGYLVTNEMPHAIYLDGKLLPTGRQLTWYSGTNLQPTAATLMRLVIGDETADAAGSANGPRTQAPDPAKRKKDILTAGLAAMMFLVGGLLLYAKELKSVLAGRPPGLSDVMAAFRNAPDEDARSPWAVEIRQLICDARFLESKKEYANALRLNKAAKDRLRKAPADGSLGEAVHRAAQFVDHRAVVLRGKTSTQ